MKLPDWLLPFKRRTEKRLKQLEEQNKRRTVENMLDREVSVEPRKRGVLITIRCTILDESISAYVSDEDLERLGLCRKEKGDE